MSGGNRIGSGRRPIYKHVHFRIPILQHTIIDAIAKEKKTTLEKMYLEFVQSTIVALHNPINLPQQTGPNFTDLGQPIERKKKS